MVLTIATCHRRATPGRGLNGAMVSIESSGWAPGRERASQLARAQDLRV